MIGYLAGKILEVGEDTATLNVGGVGYELTCPLGTIVSLIPGKSVEVFVHTHVREDQITLFGFSSKEEKRFFLQLLKVNGIGPKSAINMLSGAPLDRLMEFIESGDAKSLSKLPKIGKKTAEQIILTLKGKLVRMSDEPSYGVRGEIITGLANLGFKLSDVEKVVRDMPSEVALEDGIRRGLAALTTL